MKAKHLWGYFILMGILSISCAAAGKAGSEGDNTHATQKISAENFIVELTPLILSGPDAAGNSCKAYRAFQFTIRNTSTNPIYIDWNKTQYLFQDHITGGFMFEDTPYEKRDSKIKPDFLYPNNTVSKKIFPCSLVQFNGKWAHMPMSPGKNGVYLSIFVEEIARSTKTSNPVMGGIATSAKTSISNDPVSIALSGKEINQTITINIPEINKDKAGK